MALPNPIFVLLGLALFAWGLVLVRRGFWPRRKGSEPQCRGCGYSLIGLESPRCPECGATLSQFNIVVGRRPLRKGIGLLGVLIALLGAAILLAPVIGGLSEADWYHFKPAYFVMRNLRSPSSSIADNAMLELDRRDRVGELSSKYQQQIAEFGLAQQATTGQGTVTDKAVEFVERHYLAGDLTAAQKTRFGEQCLGLSLRIRPIVILGDDVPFQINEACRVTGSSGWWVHMVDADKIEIDGSIVRQGNSGSGSSSGLGSGGAFGDSVKAPPPGKHVLAVSSRVELHHGPWESTDPKEILFQEDRKLTAPFEVVAQPPPGYLTLINDPKLAAPLKASIVPGKFTVGVADTTSLQGRIQITAIPTDIAFDVFVRCNGHESRISTLAANKGYGGDWGISGRLREIGATTRPSSFDLIFRSSEKAARGSIDLHNLWNGELIYRDIPLGVDPSR